MTPYCDRGDLETIFGVNNVARWADLDNDESELVISRRIEWACQWATEFVNSRLQYGHYAVPFSPVPTLIRDLTAMYAGITLYDGRQVVSADENDKVSRQRKDFDRYLRQIHKGQLKLFDPTTDLPVTIQDESAPFVEPDTTDDDEEEWETVIL